VPFLVFFISQLIILTVYICVQHGGREAPRHAGLPADVVYENEDGLLRGLAGPPNPCAYLSVSDVGALWINA